MKLVINIQKKHFYLLAIIIMVATAFVTTSIVIAYNTAYPGGSAIPSNFGHTGDEINVDCQQYTVRHSSNLPVLRDSDIYCPTGYKIITGGGGCNSQDLNIFSIVPFANETPNHFRSVCGSIYNKESYAVCCKFG